MTLVLALAMASVFLLVWFGSVLVVSALRGHQLTAMQFIIVALPATYLVWYFFMRGSQ